MVVCNSWVRITGADVCKGKNIHDIDIIVELMHTLDVNILESEEYRTAKTRKFNIISLGVKNVLSFEFFAFGILYFK